MLRSSIVLLLTTVAFNSNAYVSPAPSMGSMGTDEVRLSDGSSCRSERGGNVIVYASGYGSEDEGYYEGQDKGVSLGVAYRFGGSKPLDCSKLYNKSLTMKDLEIERLKIEMEQLRNLAAIQSGVTSGIIPPPPKR